MARYKRYYRRVVRAAKKKWAPNTVEVRVSSATQVGSSSYNCLIQTIVQNGTRITSAGAATQSTMQILKTSRFRFRGVISASASTGVSLLYYIAYLPEGTSTLYAATNDSTASLGDSIFYTHPEWVMAWGRKDFIDASQSNELSLTTKLKRNLNSGDQIVFVCQWVNLSSSSVLIPSVVGTLSYMCCAN